MSNKVKYRKHSDPVYGGQVFKLTPALDLDDMTAHPYYDVYDLYGSIFDCISEQTLEKRYICLNNLELAVLRAELDIENDEDLDGAP